MTRHSIRTRGAAAAAAALVALAVTFGPSAEASVPTTTPVTSVAACASAAVLNWLNTTADGTAGSVYYQVQFTNVSSHKCSLYGFPGVSAVNAAAHQVGAAAVRTSGTARVVDLAAGQSAESALQVVATVNFSSRACQPQTARGIRVFAPGATTSDVIPFPFSTCANSHTVSLHVGPVHAD